MITLPTSKSTIVLPENPVSSRRPFLTPIPGDPGAFLLVIDNTSLEKIKRCHKAAHNYLVLGREAHAKNAALTFGGAIHEGLELFHRHQFYSEEWTDANALEENNLKHGPSVQDQAILRFFTENPAPPDDYRTAANALEVLKHYRRRSDTNLHPDYEWEIMSDDSGPIIERAFELPMAVLEFDDLWIPADETTDNGEPIKRFNEATQSYEVKVESIHLAWSGRIDLVTKSNARVRITDHKTSSIDGDTFTQSFFLSSQTIGYNWAGQQLWPDLGISGFCLNCIRLKRPTGSVGIAERGPRGGDPALAFFRAYYDYSQDLIDRWHRDTVLLIEDFIHSLSRNVFPMNDRQCFDKFGRCPYHDVCTIDNEEAGIRFLMSEAYKQVTWNPTAGR